MTLTDRIRELEHQNQRRRRWRAPRAMFSGVTSFLFGACILGVIIKSIVPSFVDSLPPSSDAVRNNVAHVFFVGAVAWLFLVGVGYVVVRFRAREEHQMQASDATVSPAVRLSAAESIPNLGRDAADALRLHTLETSPKLSDRIKAQKLERELKDRFKKA